MMMMMIFFLIISFTILLAAPGQNQNSVASNSKQTVNLHMPSDIVSYDEVIFHAEGTLILICKILGTQIKNGLVTL